MGFAGFPAGVMKGDKNMQKEAKGKILSPKKQKG